VWVGAPERTKPLICRLTNQRLEAEPNRVRIRLGTARRLRTSQQIFVDVERLFHTYNNAISVWLPALYAPTVSTRGLATNSNSSPQPANRLVRIQRLDLVQAILQSVLIPPAVARKIAPFEEVVLSQPATLR
jgi:hypothetical protein